MSTTRQQPEQGERRSNRTAWTAVSRATIRTPAPDGEIFAPDALANIPPGSVKVNGVTVGRVVAARVVDGGRWAEYDVEMNEDEGIDR